MKILKVLLISTGTGAIQIFFPSNVNKELLLSKQIMEIRIALK